MIGEKKREAIDKLIANLQGSSQNLTEELAADYDLSLEDREVTDAIDQAIFECSACGWWFESCEESDENPGICEGCSDGMSDDD
jgi:hypothetical protein